MTVFRLESAGGVLPTIIFAPEYHHVDEGGERIRHVLPRLETPILELVDGTWRTSPAKIQGRVLDTFSLFSNQSRDSIRFAVNALEAMLKLAKESQNGIDGRGEVSLVASTQDEFDIRRAVVYGGTIEVTDSRLYGRALEGDAVRLTISIERDKGWDFNTKTEHLWTKISVHGGTQDFPVVNPTIENADSRMSRMSISPTGGGYLERVWLGIKSARRDLTNFSPQIRVEERYVALESGGDTSDYPPSSSDNDVYIGGKGLLCSFKNNRGWYPRFHCPLYNWNTKAEALEEGGSPYIGEYYLLARMHTDAEDEVYGVRVATTWWGSKTGSFLPPVYIKAEDTKGAFPYFNMGKINIGGTRWTPGMDGKMYPRWFVVSMHATVLGDGGFPLFFDDMFIIPAERSLHLSLPFPLNVETKVEIFNNSDGSTRAFIVQRDDNDKLTGGNARRLHAEITDISTNNWTIPAEGGRLVMVSDRGLSATKDLEATNRINVEVTRRTEFFVG